MTPSETTSLIELLLNLKRLLKDGTVTVAYVKLCKEIERLNALK